MKDSKRAFVAVLLRPAADATWISMVGLALLIAIAVMLTRPINAQDSKRRGGGGGGGGGGVSLLIEVSSTTTSATADVTICGADCAKKSLVCTSLDASGASANEICGSGGGWKLYEYTIHVGTTTCTSPAPLSIGTPAPTCSDATGNAFLFAN
jgi:hypothetical protein